MKSLSRFFFLIVYLILNVKEMINFGNNLEEFIKDFK